MHPVRLAPLLWAAACVPEPGVESRALYELERLAFVPPARCTLDEYTSWPFADCSPMLVKLELIDCSWPSVSPGSGALRVQVLFAATCVAQSRWYRKPNGTSSILSSCTMSQ